MSDETRKPRDVVIDLESMHARTGVDLYRAAAETIRAERQARARAEAERDTARRRPAACSNGAGVVSTCASCGAPIVWTRMATGKAMPLDAKPLKVVVIERGIGSVVDGYTSHFATCPNAAQHRKPKTPKTPLEEWIK